MHPKEQIEMMQRCVEDITQLRRTIDQLAPKAEAYEVLAMSIKSMYKQPGQGMGEDVVWLLKRKIEEVKRSMTETSGAQD